jgi:hypothetical protein
MLIPPVKGVFITMNISIKKAMYSALGCLMLLFLATSAHATPTGACPIISGSGGGEGTDATYTADSGVANGGCNVLITFGSGGSITTTNPNGAGYYDTGADDNMVGIINNSGSTIYSITLTSTTQDIFGFDFDGPCSGFTLSFGSCSGGDPSGYAGTGVSFTVSSYYSGTVNFAGGIANGGTAWFGLEGPASLTASGVTVGTTPEPSTLVLLGTGIVGFFLLRRNA